MQFGFGSPTRAPLGNGENVSRIVRKADELGFSFVSVADHIFPPALPRNSYPYTATGAPPWDSSGNVMEMLTLMTFIGGLSSRLRLVSGIMVLPLRHPLLTAKILATIDVLTQGRLTLGCGVGWESGEFEVLGAPPFVKRGQVTNEYLRLFKKLWTSEETDFAGEFVQLSGYPFAPKPVQKPHPPIWIGGEGPAAMRRTAALGNGWYPIISNSSHPLNTPARYAEAVRTLHGLCRREGRDPGEIDLGLVVFNYSLGEERRSDSGDREAFTGTIDQILDDVKRYRDVGLKNVMLRLTHRDSLDQSLNRMERFAEGVMSRL